MFKYSKVVLNVTICSKFDAVLKSQSDLNPTVNSGIILNHWYTRLIFLGGGGSTVDDILLYILKGGGESQYGKQTVNPTNQSNNFLSLKVKAKK